MQLLSAFSRPQTVPDTAGIAPKKSLWILDSWRDLVLYVGTPLLLLPAFALAQARWSPQDIYLFVAAFGAMGHHLPGRSVDRREQPPRDLEQPLQPARRAAVRGKRRRTVRAGEVVHERGCPRVRGQDQDRGLARDLFPSGSCNVQQDATMMKT